MADKNQPRTATPKQLVYIQRLKSELGEDSQEIAESLSVEEASQIIDRLLAKMKQNGNGQIQSVKVNDARLGMAMKECFKLWRKNGWDIYEEKRQRFKKDVIRTYNLFTEIAQAVEEGQQMASAEA